MDKPEIPYGYCHCGCGQKTRLAKQNDKKKHWTKGQPLLYIWGHILHRARNPLCKICKTNPHTAYSSYCRCCMNKKQQKRRAADPFKIQEYNKRSLTTYRATPKSQEQRREYRRVHREELIESCKEYRKNHPECKTRRQIQRYWRGLNAPIELLLLHAANIELKRKIKEIKNGRKEEPAVV